MQSENYLLSSDARFDGFCKHPYDIGRRTEKILNLIDKSIIDKALGEKYKQDLQNLGLMSFEEQNSLFEKLRKKFSFKGKHHRIREEKEYRKDYFEQPIKLLDGSLSSAIEIKSKFEVGNNPRYPIYTHLEVIEAMKGL